MHLDNSPRRGPASALIVIITLAVAGALAWSACAPRQAAAGLIPWPVEATLGQGAGVPIEKTTVIELSPAGNADLRRIARGLAELLRPALDATIEIRDASASVPVPAAGSAAARGPAPARAIRLAFEPKPGSAEEGYQLDITPDGISITGSSAAGVFYGVQTLRQLLPPWIESRGVRPRAVLAPQAHIIDHPRFAWRGAMLDVARHFFGPAEVRRYIDLLALYKFNHLHLHLSDDQGWRIEIASWPNLTTHGGSTAVGGGAGGFYTKQDYADLIAYARDRFITIVPEIDMPSHINAALASYPELNCNNTAPPLYTGIDVGFSAFCVEKDVTYKFIDDVMRELAEMTPGPFLHIGGDEVKTLTPAQYATFMNRAQAIVKAHGKVPIAWDEIAHATLEPETIVQYWRPDASIKPPANTKLILSPANKIYLDMKYDDQTVLGLNWAGNVAVNVPYEWDPAKLLPDVPETAILGVEAPIWSETLTTIADVEFMAFPRIAGVSELAWSPQSSRSNWNEFRGRLATQAPRWSALGINAFWSPAIDWRR
jgi:hexosaminidase